MVDWWQFCVVVSKTEAWVIFDSFLQNFHPIWSRIDWLINLVTSLGVWTRARPEIIWENRSFFHIKSCLFHHPIQINWLICSIQSTNQLFVSCLLSKIENMSFKHGEEDCPQQLLLLGVMCERWNHGVSVQEKNTYSHRQFGICKTNSGGIFQPTQFIWHHILVGVL